MIFFYEKPIMLPLSYSLSHFSISLCLVFTLGESSPNYESKQMLFRSFSYQLKQIICIL